MWTTVIHDIPYFIIHIAIKNVKRSQGNRYAVCLRVLPTTIFIKTRNVKKKIETPTVVADNIDPKMCTLTRFSSHTKIETNLEFLHKHFVPSTLTFLRKCSLRLSHTISLVSMLLHSYTYLHSNSYIYRETHETHETHIFFVVFSHYYFIQLSFGHKATRQNSGFRRHFLVFQAVFKYTAGITWEVERAEGKGVSWIENYCRIK